MAQMQEMKVIKVNDGVYNGTYKIGDEICFFWTTNSESFKKYFEKYCDSDDFEGIAIWDEWEAFGTLKGWTETDIILDMDLDELISIPIADIYSMYT